MVMIAMKFAATKPASSKTNDEVRKKNLSSHFKITGILKKVRFYKHADF